MCYYNPLHRSRKFINQYFRLTDQNAKLFTRNHDMCFAEKSARMRPGCSRWSAAWSKHWRQCVWLTCQTRTRDTLASRCSKRAARKPPKCGTGDRAKNTHCELSSFGPALFEIWWPDIYLGGPYGPVTDKMYWPELVRRSEKCAGPAGQCLCRGLPYHDELHTFRGDTEQRRHRRNGGSSCGWAPLQTRHDDDYSYGFFCSILSLFRHVLYVLAHNNVQYCKWDNINE